MELGNLRSSTIRAKAHEQLSTLTFRTDVNLPDPLDVQERDADNLSGSVYIAHKHDLTTAPKVTPFAENEFEPMGIKSRKILSVLSDKNDRIKESAAEEGIQTKLEELRKRPKVICNKHVWETLSESERATLFD